MAEMIPDHPPAEEVSTESERDFWRELKKQLSDEFYVYHSLPYLRTNGVQGELDYLVVHRRHGMLNIECKGDGVDRDEKGNWYRTCPDGTRERMKKSPSEQARTQIEDIIEGLQGPLRRKLDDRFRKFPLFYGWALAFPFSRAGELNLPLSLQREVLIDSADICDDLETAVIEAIEFHSRPFRGDRSLNEEQFKKLRAVISPPMSIPKEVMAASIDREKREMIRLSERQAKTVRQMVANRRVRVPGGAGTGKTVLALHGARLLAERGHDVLLTCYNSRLGSYLHSHVDEWEDLPGQIDAIHFHGLCAEANKRLGGVLEYPDSDAPREEANRFWREEMAFILMRALDEEVLEAGPWDAVIVDEGQDFAAEWWEVLEECLHEPGEGRMVVFHDDEQAIFDHGPCVPELSTEFPLFENFRNTRAISDEVQKLIDVELQSHPDVPDGEPPQIHQQPGPTKTRRLVAELLDELIEKERISCESIAVLTPHSPKSSSLEANTNLHGHPIVHDVDDWSNGVLHASIGSFKGLEANVVILVDIDPRDELCDANARYVAATRAKNRLYIFEKSHWLADG